MADESPYEALFHLSDRLRACRKLADSLEELPGLLREALVFDYLSLLVCGTPDERPRWYATNDNLALEPCAESPSEGEFLVMALRDQRPIRVWGGADGIESAARDGWVIPLTTPRRRLGALFLASGEDYPEDKLRFALFAVQRVALAMELLCEQRPIESSAGRRPSNETVALRNEIDASLMFEEIVGSSDPLYRVLAQVKRVAAEEATVLITGESGTGKELVARAIHKGSHRSGEAFIRINCAAIPPPLIASELFGYEKGAFTGANQRHIGRFEAANHGTLFLDEIGDIPIETQLILLRVLQEREFERVGGTRPIPIDVRLIAATNCELGAAVREGTFRLDLFYRLNVFPLHLPSLRERPEDIVLLAEYFAARYAAKSGKKIRNIEANTLRQLRAYDWPGNIRELQNVIERAVILCDGATIKIDPAWLRAKVRRTKYGAEANILNVASRAGGCETKGKVQRLKAAGSA